MTQFDERAAAQPRTRMRPSRRSRTSKVAVVLAGLAAWAGSRAAGAADWPQWQGPDRNAVSKETRPAQGVAEGRPAARLEGQGTRRRRQRPVHRRRADLRHEQPRRRRSRLGLSEADGKEALGDAPRAGLPAAECRRPRRGRAARRRSTATGSTSWAWAATWPACRPRRQDRLAAEPDAGLRRRAARLELPRIAARRRRQAHLHARRRGRDPGGPRQADRQDHLEEPGARQSAGRPTPRPSPSTSTGSASTCSSPRRHARRRRGGRRQVPLAV